MFPQPVRRVDRPDRGVFNLFYRLAFPAWGEGIGSAAATAVTDWATRTVPDIPVIARVRPENVASQRIALRAGLVRARYLDDVGFDGPDWVFAPDGYR